MRRALGYKLEVQGWLLQRVRRLSRTDAARRRSRSSTRSRGRPRRPGRTRPIGRSGCRSCASSPAICRRSIRHARSRPRRLLPYRPARDPLPLRPEEIAALMHAASALPLPLQAATYRTLIGLLAVTGLRLGEAIRLDRDDSTTDDAAAADPPQQVRQEPRGRAARQHDARAARLWPAARPALPAAALRGVLCLDPRHPAARPDIHEISPGSSRPPGSARARRAAVRAHTTSGMALPSATLLDWYRDGARRPSPAAAALHLHGARQPRQHVLVPDRRARAARARRRPARADAWRESHDHARADPRGVLHRPAAPPAAREPEHDRLLPRHVPAAARLRPAADRHAGRHASSSTDLDATDDRRVPRAPRDRARATAPAPATFASPRSTRSSTTARCATPSMPP